MNTQANQNDNAAPNRDIGADIAATAKSWAGKSYKPGETERCQDFVNHVLNQASPGLADKIGTTRQAQDGLESGEYLASRFAGRDVGTPVSKDQLRPGDIVIVRGAGYVSDGVAVEVKNTPAPEATPAPEREKRTTQATGS